jgi:hydroxymethylbilane synthase
VSEIRGNVGTRLRKLAEQAELDAIVLAAAGLRRLGFFRAGTDRIQCPEAPDGLLGTLLPLEEMLPCVGQAAIGIECRERDARIERVCAALNDPDTHACVIAERAFLRGMGGGCQLAVAAHATISDGQLRLRAVSFLGAKPVRGERSGPSSDAEKIGQALANQLKP